MASINSIAYATDTGNTAAAKAAQGNKNTPVILNSNVAPGYDDLKALFNTSVPSYDVVWQPYYDSVALVSATAGTYKFFQAPNTGGNYLSNLSGANGRLAGDQAMLVKSIWFQFTNADTSKPIDVTVAKELFKTLYFKFWVMNKSYYDNNGLPFIDPQAGLTVSTQFYASQPFRRYNFPIDVVIPPNASFFVEATWSATTLAQTSTLQCTIEGVLYRGVQ